MSRVTQAVIAALGLAVAGSAFARYEDEVRVRDSFFDYARVVNVDRIVQADTQPVTREECTKVPRDEYREGPVVRREVDEHADSNGSTVRTETVDRKGYYERTYADQCEKRTDFVAGPAQTVAFDVVYRYDGQDYHSRMSHDPGRRVRVHIDNGYVEVAE